MRNANVLWISIDSLRKDFLAIYNPSYRQTFLDEMANEGCVFENAFPGGNWTMPSHASMLTGLDATTHMIWDWRHRFPSGTQTVFEIFHRAGYETGCFCINQLAELFAGLPIDHLGLSEHPSLLKCIRSDKPFFIFWHTYKVHYPYGVVPPVDYDGSDTDYDQRSNALNYLRHLIMTGRKEIILDAYRRQLQGVARFIQFVAGQLKKLGKLERTYFVITADHGEAWEPYTTFHCNFKEEVVRVPLAIVGPELSPMRVADSVSLAGLPATMMDLCEIDDYAADAFETASFLPLIRGKEEEDHPLVIGGMDGIRARHRYVSVRNRDWVLVKAMNHWWESFHRIVDGGLSENLLDRPLPDGGYGAIDDLRAIAVRQMEKFLRNKDNTVTLTQGTEKKLRAFGYV